MSVQIVFIDSRVPGIQELLEGLKPGEQAFVIDVLAGLPASTPYPPVDPHHDFHLF